MAKRFGWYVLLIAVGLTAGAVVAKRRATPTVLTAATSNTAESQAAVVTNNTVGETSSINAPVSNAPGSTPPAAPTVVAVPALEPIVYQPAANEQAAVKTIKAFYQAYNTADEAGLIGQFDLSVSVTAAARSAIAAGVARPVKVTITQIDTRSDDTQVATVQETRSDSGALLSREIELFPTKSGVLISAYRAAGQAEVTSGFSN